MKKNCTDVYILFFPSAVVFVESFGYSLTHSHAGLKYRRANRCGSRRDGKNVASHCTNKNTQFGHLVSLFLWCLRWTVEYGREISCVCLCLDDRKLCTWFKVRRWFEFSHFRFQRLVATLRLNTLTPNPVFCQYLIPAFTQFRLETTCERMGLISKSLTMINGGRI